MNSPYTIRLAAGQGLVDETNILLDLWQPGMNATTLYRAALESGNFASVSARRLRDIVVVAFAPRYLIDDAAPAILLKTLKDAVPRRAFEQLLFLYTARANPILADFVREVYWPAYAGGKASLGNEDAQRFVSAAALNGKTMMAWSEGTQRRVASDLTGCCGDFGLLAAGAARVRKILPFRIEPVAGTILAYDLHAQNLGDNQLLAHSDWAIFGLAREDVLAELKRIALQGFLIVQSAGGVTRISWTYPSLQELANVLAQR